MVCLCWNTFDKCDVHTLFMYTTRHSEGLSFSTWKDCESETLSQGGFSHERSSAVHLIWPSLRRHHVYLTVLRVALSIYNNLVGEKFGSLSLGKNGRMEEWKVYQAKRGRVFMCNLRERLLTTFSFGCLKCVAGNTMSPTMAPGVRRHWHESCSEVG